MHVVVEQGIKRALGGAQEGKELLTQSAVLSPQSSQLVPMQIFDRPMEPQYTPLFQARPIVQPPLQTAAVAEVPPALGDLAGRVIGQYRMSYILLDTPNGLRL